MQRTFTRNAIEPVLAQAAVLGQGGVHLAKDSGAYLMAFGDGQGTPNAVVYFKGMDPHRDPDWYEAAHDAFGGDDFGLEVISAETAERLVNDSRWTKLVLTVTDTMVKFSARGPK